MPENPWVDPRPFVMGPQTADVALVLVHGFTGAPSEMRPPAGPLADAGHRVIGVQLPGHGTDESALEGVRWRDWIDAVIDGVEWAREGSRHVVLVGLSMGGLLATVAATEEPVSGLALLAPAFRIANPLLPLAGIGKFVIDSLPAPRLPNAGLTSTTGWKRLYHYDRRPLSAAWELRKLQKHAWKALPKVDVPTVVVQGARDQTLRPEGAREVYDALRVPQKAFVWLEHSGHCLTADVELDDVVAAIEELITSVHSRRE